MATFTIPGYISFEPGGVVNSVSASTLSIVVPEGTTTFSYNVDGSGFVDTTTVSSAEIDGAAVFATLSFDDTEEAFVRVTWNDGAARTAYIYNFFDTSTETSYFYQVAGDALPNFVGDPVGLAAWLGTVTITAPPPGSGFEPGATIPIGPYSTYLGEDDTLHGNDGSDTLEGGVGDDTMFGYDGTDFLLPGAGDDDIVGGNGFDTLIYTDLPVVTGILAAFSSIDAGTVAEDGTGGMDIFSEIEMIVGSVLNDSLTGTVGEQHFDGGAGIDTIDGGADFDWIEYSFSGTQGAVVDFSTNSFRDTSGDLDVVSNIEAVWGSIFGDDITGIDSIDHEFRGNDGDDTLTGANGDDTLLGGDGDDVITDGSGTDLVNGGAGNDTIINLGGSNEIFDGGDGVDTFIDDVTALSTPAGYFGTINLVTGAHGGSTQDPSLWDTLLNIENFIWNGNTDQRALITGSDVANELTSDEGNDTIDGMGGDDALNGGSGNDRLIGGEGADTLNGDAGNDVLIDRSVDANLINGGLGEDRVVTGGGDDTVNGGDDRDVIKTAGGADSINGDDGNDVILSGTENDTVFGGDGDDVIKTSTGDDFVDGGDGNDIIFTWRGDDTAIGGAGDDTIRGDFDDDIIEGGSGNDRLVGAPGRDTFIFRDGFDEDRILDFRNGSDLLDFSNHTGVSGLSDLGISQVSTNVVITDGAGGRVVLADTDILDIGVEDFVFDV